MPRGTPHPLAIPQGGLRLDVSPQHVPPGAMSDATNVMATFGRLGPRLGTNNLLAGAYGEQVMGGTYYTLPSGTTKIVAAGLTTWKQANLGAGTWDTITGNALTGNADSQVQFVVWPEGGVIYAIGVNNKDTPKEWNGTAGTYSELTGLSQWTTAKDITVSANRIIVCNTLEGALRYPYRIRFSDFNTRSSWTASNVIDLTDINDTLVAVRGFTRATFAILGTKTQYVGVARSGVFPFSIELQDVMPGPASPASVVARFGAVYYMGQDASFYVFDGNRTTHIGESIRKRVQANTNYTNIGRSHGFYFDLDRSFWWFFPTTTAEPTDAVRFRPETNEWTYHTFTVALTSSWYATVQSGLTWTTLPVGWTWTTIDTSTYPMWSSFAVTSTPTMLVGSTTQIMQMSNTGNDNGTAIPSSWELLVPDQVVGSRKRVDAVESFFLAPSVSTTLTLSIGSTDTLAALPTYPSALQLSTDISVDQRHLLDTAQAATGEGTTTSEAQFLFVKHAISGTVPWEWRGGTVYAEAQRVE